mmetsp:Transcript_17933/g.47359  ORF Transcript_17933/g.47359 Transcript_17933/m.47359 type:complete len:273 (+) Transcript_17933:46-864(+)
MAEEALPPEVIDLDGNRWIRTEIARGSDLVNGKAWMDDFGKQCRQEVAAAMAATAAAAAAAGAADGGQAAAPGRRRLLRQVASAGDEPQYWKTSGELANSDKNRLMERLRNEAGYTGPGRRVVLPTGDEVMFWFNVGPGADRLDVPAADRVFVTSAACPHQQVCLEGGELREIEDLAGTKKSVIRCPRHNRLFDVSTGEGEGNLLSLRKYPARFFHQHKRFYVAIGPSPPPPSAQDDAMDLDPPEPKRMKLGEPAAVVPTPARTLIAQRTMI